ncbi:MAG: hypothetical protein ACFFAE_10660 [Candidatus Hodarchaeota archaeon]
MKRCYFCNATIKSAAKYCSKCGQKQLQETKSLSQTQQKIDIEFTKERKSLERAIQRFDRIFANQIMPPVSSQDLLFNQKKIWYLNQKERFLHRNISNEMFYNHLKSLKEYLESTAIIPKTREEIKPDKHHLFEVDEEKQCWTCGKSIREGSPYLTFCSKTCEREYIPYETGVEILPSSSPKQKEVRTEADYHKEIIQEPHKSVELIDVSVSESLPEIPDLEPTASNITDINSSKEIITEFDQTKFLVKEKESLFSSIQYQVQDLITEQGMDGPIVRIIPYSGSIKEIKVTFHPNQIIMEGCLKKPNLPLVKLELKTEGEPRQLSWEDPWQNITLFGEENVLKRIKMRTEIAERIVSLGEAEVKVESQTKGEICLRLSCIETEEAIKSAYSLIKDLQLFFEISFY